MSHLALSTAEEATWTSLGIFDVGRGTEVVVHWNTHFSSRELIEHEKRVVEVRTCRAESVDHDFGYADKREVPMECIQSCVRDN